MSQAESAGDLETQFDLIASDYVYIDVSGKRVTKADLQARRNEDDRRGITNVASDLEVVPITRDAALTRGRWDTRAVYYGGLPREDAARYMALWRKRGGRWVLVADQVTPVSRQTSIAYERVSLSADQLARFEGAYILETDPVLQIQLQPHDETVVMRIPMHLENGVTFYPSSETTLFAIERPWTIEINGSGPGLTITTWGEMTAGRRID